MVQALQITYRLQRVNRLDLLEQADIEVDISVIHLMNHHVINVKGGIAVIARCCLIRQSHDSVTHTGIVGRASWTTG